MFILVCTYLGNQLCGWSINHVCMNFLTIIVKMSLTHLEINHFYYLFYAKVNFVKGFGRQD